MNRVFRSSLFFTSISPTKCLFCRTLTTGKLFTLKKYEDIMNPKTLQLISRKDIVERAKTLIANIHELKELHETSKDELVEELAEEETRLIKEAEEIQVKIAEELTRDNDDVVHKVLVEINAGVGGQEAMLFANEIYDIYLKLCVVKNWSINIINDHSTDLGGISHVAFEVEGQFCYKTLRHEAGVHRVQRIPKTEKSGRVHTSTITVNVLPINEAEDAKEIPPKDLKMWTKRSTGAGGQHVNKTESCVVLQHVPTGITTECQETRFQDQNKVIAMRKLKQLLWLKEKDRLLDEYHKTKKSQVASAARSEKIRTYNFIQDRITDHRISENVYNIKSYMSSDNACSGILSLISILEKETKRKQLEAIFEQMK